MAQKLKKKWAIDILNFKNLNIFTYNLFIIIQIIISFKIINFISMKNTSILILLTLLQSCSSIRVSYDYDKKMDFKKYKSFSFPSKLITDSPISELDKNRIIESIKSNMDSLGIKQSNLPDLLIRFSADATRQILINNNTFFNDGHGYFHWGYTPMFSGPRPYTTSRIRGELIIDLIDFKTKKLVWQGIGKGYISPTSKKRDERIREFVSLIMSKYPKEKN